MPIIIPPTDPSPATIVDYASLQAAVTGWSHRTDLNDNIGDFISLAEGRMYDLMILRDMESDEALTLTASQNYVALPTGYISPIKFWLVVSSLRLELSPALPQELPYYTTAAQPRYWAIDGDNIRFDCPAQSAYSAYLRCVKKANLSVSATTNYLLTRRPDIYLAGALVEVARYTQDDKMFAAWEPKFLQAVKELKAAENRARGIVPLRSDLGRRSRSNIYNGE